MLIILKWLIQLPVQPVFVVLVEMFVVLFLTIYLHSLHHLELWILLSFWTLTPAVPFMTLSIDPGSDDQLTRYDGLKTTFAVS